MFMWPSPRVWTLNHTAQILQVPRLDICRPKGPFLTLLSAKMSLRLAQRLCTAAASDVVIPTSQNETETILSLTLEAGSSCSGRPNEPLMWLGASDEDTEGRWVDEEGRLLSYENWMEGQPNGMTLENRAVMTNAGTWMDLHTRNYQYCAVCSTKNGRPLLLRVRGLCSSLQHDTRYIQEGHVLAKPFFRGFTVSNISWSGTKWLAQHKDSPEVVLSFTPEDPRELPLGRKTWMVAGKSDCGDESGRLVLALTTCAPGHFTCDDGSCIPANMRCDFQSDCKDESDETECETVTLPPAYKSNIPPRPASPTPDAAAHPISLHINVLSLEIVTGKMEIVMDFTATLRWTDPRLVFRDLKHDQATNALQLPALRSLWVPQVRVCKGVTG
ncbi:uncharacterized protein LOC123520045 [Portunus trituberculatus]|uniref:uncharacterized protein LOC123520045 n=1 Tax=Portunus trituberculatus TaxID=210409 RepID=UPI001E1CF762|nr:uncharacterized protein LOC123520045 [Portunus trituberculatus]